MNARARRIISLTLACSTSVVLVGFLLARQPRPDIQLVFVGYTNVFFEVGRKGSSDRRTLWLTKAILEVTNCGSVPVRIAPVTQAYPASQLLSEIKAPYLAMMSSPAVKPGKSEAGAVYVPQQEPRWRANVAYSRLDCMESLTDKARNSRFVVVRTVARRLLPSPRLVWAQSDWITNSSTPARHYHITAPPPDIRIELPPLRPRQ